MKKLKLILKILLGLVFILSGVLKLIDIDKFELYVYSFNFLSLSFSYIVARLLIAFEFLLGVSLVANVFNKYVVRTTLAMLVGFTLFLVYLIVIGRNDNCHCFGEYVQFNPIESIVKNILFTAVLLFCWNVEPFKIRIRWYITALAMLVPFAVVFIVSPPDNLVKYPTQAKYSVNEELFAQHIAPDGALDTLNISKGKKLVALYSPKCKYCKMSARKINTIRQRVNIPDENIITVFGGEVKDLTPFYTDTETPPLQPMFMDGDLFLPLTYGRFPAVLLLQDGSIAKAFQYRSISESEIEQFFLE